MTNRAAGFTLLEMIAALGVFSVIIIIFSATFLSLLNAERRTQIAANVQDNLRFALEVMAKEIRTGTGYSIPSSPSNTSITFTNADNVPVTYRLSGSDLLSNPCNLNPCIGKVISGKFLPLTSKQISVQKLEFYPLSGSQPSVQIVIRARAMVQNVETELTVQTTISKRKVGNI